MMLERMMFRRQLEKENFFAEVTFEDAASKKSVEQWLFDLKRKHGICFSGFKQLFDEWGWEIFPTTIRCEEISEDSVNLVVTDQCGLDFYLKFKRNQDQNTEFEITKKEENEQFKKIWTFQSTRSFKAELKKLEEHDEEKVTTLVTDFSKKTVKVSVRNKDNSRKVSALFEKHSIKDPNAVFEFFKNMKFDYCANIRQDPDVKRFSSEYRDVIFEAFIKDNKCSEMVKQSGRVCRYMYTERIRGTNDFGMYTILKGKLNY